MNWTQELQIISNIVQVLGVIWIFAFGGKAVLDVIRDISKHQPIRRVSAATITNVLLALIFLALVSLRFYPTSSPTPTVPTVQTILPTPLPTSSLITTTPKEKLSVPFTAGLNGATTKYSYSGITTITVSGTGQAYNQEYSDAFYVYTINSGQTQVTGYRVAGFSLCINYQAVDHFVQSIPVYNPNHSYTFQIDAPGGFLTVGICDNGVSDNSGSFTVMLF